MAGPPTTAAARAAGWAEAVVLLAGARGALAPVVDPRTGAVAEAEIGADGTVRVRVQAGRAARRGGAALLRHRRGPHGAVVGVLARGSPSTTTGTVHDLTIRSFGVLRAVDTPPIEVEVVPGDGPPVRGSDAVFAAVRGRGLAPRRHPDRLADGHPLALSRRAAVSVDVRSMQLAALVGGLAVVLEEPAEEGGRSRRRSP